MAGKSDFDSDLKGLEGADLIDALLKKAYSLISCDLEQMRCCIDKALAISSEEGTNSDTARCMNLYSIYYGSIANYQKALECAFEALKIDEDHSDPDQLAKRYSNISIIYGRLSQPENSVKYCLMALEQAEKSGNTGQAAAIRNNLGVAFDAIGDTEKALENFTIAADLLKTLGPPEQYALALINAGQQYRALDRFEEAIRSIRGGLKVARDAEAVFSEAAAMLELAELYTEDGYDSFEIIDILDSVSEKAEQLDSPSFRSRVAWTKAECFEKLGEYSAALTAFREYSELREKVLDLQKLKLIADLERDFELQKKEKEAEIYRLRNVELAKAMEDARAADRAKSDFLALMSHEIRTPLNVILGMIELTLRTELLPTQRDWLQKTTLASKSLMELINDILDYSRIDADRIVFEDIVFSPADLVRDSVTMFETPASEKLLELRYSIPDHCPEYVRGDPARLGQVLRNLLSNAIKFTEHGEIEVSIGVHSHSPDCAQLAFSVRDTGPGISQNIRSAIFEPFVQAGSSIARTHGGSGLGLSICRRLMEGMGGELTLSCNPGEGCLFTAAASFYPVPPDEVPVLEEASKGAGISEATILIVEDMEPNREVARLFLEQLGASALEAVDGREAIEVCEREKPDLVLMDVQMPVMNGMQAAEILREKGFRGPVIAVTAHSEKHLADACHKSGMDDVLTKPFSIAELDMMLSKWLSSGKPGA